MRLLLLWLTLACAAFGAAMGTTVQGKVSDPSGSAVPGATVRIHNPITHYSRVETTDATGAFRMLGVPPNIYHVSVKKDGFAEFITDLDVRGDVPLSVIAKLQVAGQSASMTVEAFGSDVLENVPYAHYDVDRNAMARLPMNAPGNTLGEAITMSAPGVVADSNGFFHPLGDHAQAAFVIDGQPVNDQQSKQFSTQIPLNAIQALELVTGGVNAEYGDKTSLVVNAMTRSGLGQDRGTGSVVAQYGSFGTVAEETAIGFGGKRLGNFLAANALRTGRFLDTPEFRPIHAAGNNFAIFDRLDYRPSDATALNLNVFAARNWFQVPNSYDQLDQDQRQKTETFSIAPSWQRTFGPRAVLSINGFLRQDRVNYYPSRDWANDSPATLSQRRHLSNGGVRVDLSLTRGVHNFKAGYQLMQTRLDEQFSLGITDEHLVDDAPGLKPYLLPEGGKPFRFAGKANINQWAGYVQDAVKLGNLTLNAGVRVDRYKGLAEAWGGQPRIGASYLIAKTGTVLRWAYSRTMETPYNENLVLASSTGSGGLAENVFGAFGASPIRPGNRNQHNAGVQQALGKWAQIDADYFWKRTENAYDFGALFDTPIFFPISWNRSQIDGLAVRIATSNWRGFQAQTQMGTSRSRFFGPSNGGLLFNSPLETGVFRIDHDQRFQQTTTARYQYRRGPWIAMTWRYDNGLVAGAVEDADEVLALSGARQAAMGLSCGAVVATRFSPITQCAAALSASRIRIPKPGTADADHNPPRIAPRHLFHASVGIDSLFSRERFRTSIRFTAVNLTNRVALYNFLSTFAGTHFVTPRAYTAELGFHF